MEKASSQPIDFVFQCGVSVVCIHVSVPINYRNCGNRKTFQIVDACKSRILFGLLYNMLSLQLLCSLKDQ